MTTPKPVQTESEVRTKPSGVEGHANPSAPVHHGMVRSGSGRTTPTVQPAVSQDGQAGLGFVGSSETYSCVRPDVLFWDEADRRPILKGQRLRLWWARNAENVWAAVIVLGVWWFAWLCAGSL